MQALWLYIKHNQLQDGHEREYINCNRYFRQVSWDTGPPLVSQPPSCLRLQSSTGLVLSHILHTAPGMVHFPVCPHRHHQPSGALSRSSVVADSVSLRFP